MKLYHGTSERALARILKQGITPRSQRGKNKGNWKHTVTSHPDCVYLTSVYGLYFAMCATGSKVSGRPVVIEVDTLRLNPFKLWPDEDFLAHMTKHAPGMPIGLKLRERSAWYRDRLGEYAHLWDRSVAGMGTCAYNGTVISAAITRYVMVDTTKQGRLLCEAVDPSISIWNYIIVGSKYRAMTNWLFNDPVDLDQMPAVKVPAANDTFTQLHLWTPPTTREGLHMTIVD